MKAFEVVITHFLGFLTSNVIFFSISSLIEPRAIVCPHYFLRIRSMYSENVPGCMLVAAD